MTTVTEEKLRLGM